MKTKDKRGLIPKLRFPEFTAEASWERKRLVDLADEKIKWSFIGGPFGSNLKASDYTPNGIRIIQLQNIGESEFLDNYRIFTSEEKADELLSCNIYPGDIILSKMGDPVARACIIPGSSPRYLMCSDGIRLVVNEREYNKYFVFLLINFDVFRRRADSAATGSTRKRIGLDVLRELPLETPSLPEQQKIAECLGTLDALIGAESQKLDSLKAHKKGLMQQLFPREGETLPRLRFPEFQDAPGWEKIALGEIAEIKLGKMLDSKKHTTGRLLPYLNNVSVRWNEVNTSNLPQMYFEDDELDRFGLKAGDVVVCEGGEPGRSAVWDGRLSDLKFQKAIHRVRFNVPFEARLLVLYLEAIAGTTQLEMIFTGGGIKHLTRETFAQLKIPLISHAEQKRIVSCLSSLDDLIAAQSDKLETLKTHKKGLMQQLFPSPTEAET